MLRPPPPSKGPSFTLEDDASIPGAGAVCSSALTNRPDFLLRAWWRARISLLVNPMRPGWGMKRMMTCTMVGEHFIFNIGCFVIYLTCYHLLNRTSYRAPLVSTQKLVLAGHVFEWALGPIFSFFFSTYFLFTIIDILVKQMKVFPSYFEFQIIFMHMHHFSVLSILLHPYKT